MVRKQHKSTNVQCALVEWVDGVHAGHITHNVDLDWIINLDAASPEFPETYAIEWRVQPKPRSGWPVYNGRVLDISSDLDYLQSKADALRKLGDSSSDTGDDTLASRNRSTCSTLLDINSDAFRQLLRTLTQHNQDGSPQSNKQRSESFTTEEKVTVGKSLSVPTQVYAMALNASSPGRMVRPLLRQAFSRRRLIRSSYAGQKRKKGEREVIKPGLKKYQKMADIHAFVLRKYPHISQAAFGGIVNSFLGEKPNMVHTMEYVEESHSESEEED